MQIHLFEQEFRLLCKYIEDNYGIAITREKAYLLESRLGRVLAEAGLPSFMALYESINKPQGKLLAEQVIDAITTNETSWFRDGTPWLILEELFLPALLREIQDGRRQRVRIWSAACSTGQEPYSIAMAIAHYLQKNRITDVRLEQFEIIATDVSRTVLRLAQTACYDQIAMQRGLSKDYWARYFYREGEGWRLAESLRQAVHFQFLNLQRSFNQLGDFDFVFCRYVAIYFSENYKQLLFHKISRALQPAGVLFIGSSEILAGCQDVFSLEQYKNGVYYAARRDKTEKLKVST